MGPLRHVVLGASFAFPGTSGSPLLQMDAADSLVRRGIGVTVVRYCGTRPLRTTRRSWHGIDVHDVPLASSATTLAGVFRSVRPDVVYAHGALSAELLSPAALVAGVPVVVEVHARPDLLAPRPGIASLVAPHELAGRLMRRATDRVIVLSERDRDAMARAGWAPPHGVEVLYPPVPEVMVASDAALPDDAPSAGGPPTVGYVGSYQPWQGEDLLFEAMGPVWASHPDVVLHLWGADEAEQRRLAERARGLPGQVVVGGRVDRDQIIPLVRRFGVAVIPRPDVPVNATTSRKLGEFLISGTPVLATDVADHRRLLDGGAGVVTPPTAAGVAEGLVQLLGDAAMAARVGRAGRALAEQRFAAASVESRRVELLGHAARLGRRARRRGAAPEGTSQP